MESTLNMTQNLKEKKKSNITLYFTVRTPPSDYADVIIFPSSFTRFTTWSKFIWFILIWYFFPKRFRKCRPLKVYTNGELKIFLYVCVHIKSIPWKFSNYLPVKFINFFTSRLIFILFYCLKLVNINWKGDLT